MNAIAKCVDDLLVAFPGHKGTGDRVAAIYSHGLRGLDVDSVQGAVDIAIRDDLSFPKVARLWELAKEWQKRNRAEMYPVIEEDKDTCQVCGARAKHVTLMRPRTDGERGSEEFTSRVQYITHNPDRHHVKPEPT